MTHIEEPHTDPIADLIDKAEKDPGLKATTDEMEKESLAKREAHKVANNEELQRETEQIKALIGRYKQQFESLGITLGVKTQRVPRMSAFGQDDYNDYFVTLEKNGKIEEVALPGFISNSFSIKTTDMMSALFEGIKAKNLEVKDVGGNAEGRIVTINGAPTTGLSFRMKEGHQDFQEAKARWSKPEVGYYAWLESLKKAVETMSGS